MCSTIAEALAVVETLPADAPVDSAELIALRRLADRAQALYLSRLARFDVTDACRADDYGSTWTWLRDHARALPTEARSEMWLARRLHNDVTRAMPATEAALAAGDLTVGQARAIAGALSRLPADRAVEMEPTLVHEVVELGPAATPKLCAHVVDIGEDEDALGRAERERAARHLNIRPVGGMFHLDGLLPPAQAAPVITALEAFSQRIPAGPGRAPDDRTAPQRRADALAELAETVLDRGAPTLGGLRPHVQVVINVEDLVDDTGHGSEQHVGGLRAADVRETSCDAEASWIGVRRTPRDPSTPDADHPEDQQDLFPIDPRLGEQLRSKLPPALGGSALEILAAGRTVRLVPPHIRRSLNVRDQGCVNPGCDRPQERCHAHHIRHWADGGPTDLTNLVLACAHHHHHWHRGDLKPELQPDGSWRIVPDYDARAKRTQHHARAG